ncbi:MAG: glycosyltransferase family A protein [Pseudomonadota bacterium]
MPRVSVVVPCYNAGPALAPCLASILGQSVAELELILVDDGSTDGAVKAALEQHPDERIKLLQQSNSGAAAARNRGLAAARGAWINYVDADDLLAPDKLAQQLTYLAQYPEYAIIGGAWMRFTSDPPPAFTNPGDALWEPLDAVTWQVRALTQNLMIQPAAWLLSRDLATRAGGWREDLSLNDDGEYFARVMLAAGRVGFCVGARSFYRSGTDRSLSAGRGRRHFESAEAALTAIEMALREAEDSTRVQAALATAFSRLAVESYPYHSVVSGRCQGRARELGRFEPDLGGGRWVGRLVRPLGWRTARRLQALVYDLGYRRLRMGRRRGEHRV